MIVTASLAVPITAAAIGVGAAAAAGAIGIGARLIQRRIRERPSHWYQSHYGYYYDPYYQSY